MELTKLNHKQISNAVYKLKFKGKIDTYKGRMKNVTGGGQKV
jgi:hypothetical protein